MRQADGAGVSEQLMLGESPAHWSQGPLLTLDTETTGTDPLNDRIVQVTLARVDVTGTSQVAIDSLVDPGVVIPDEAIQTHGITNEQVRAQGMPPWRALAHIAIELTLAKHMGWPLVIFNASFDWPLIHAEAARYQMPMPSELHIIDPLVIDRAQDKYRKGKRKLEDMIKVYGVGLAEAHVASHDAAASAQIVRAMVQRYPPLRRLSLPTLQMAQTVWHREWRDHLNAYWRKMDIDQHIPENEVWPWGPMVNRPGTQSKNS